MRAFILGNGISIRETPLELLIGEVTIAMNKIHLCYDWGKWRPTHYLFFETKGDGHPCFPSSGPNEWWRYVVPHHIEAGEDCHLKSVYKPIIDRVTCRYQDEWPNVTYYPPGSCTHVSMTSLDEEKPQAWHPELGFCDFGGTMNIALQFAYQKGYNPVYMLGCDLGYKEITPDMTEDPNHFDPNDWTHDDFPIELRNDTHKLMFEIAKMEYEKADKELLNATIGGELEVLERVDIHDVLS